MSKIFVFGIGGTGSRILRSLTMLLSTGVRFGADDIVPIIIDPDSANADLTRTVSLMNTYSNIHGKLHFNNEQKNYFFKTGIISAMQNFTLNIKKTSDHKFYEFIAYASMTKANQAITKMLFSDKNLQSSMDVGFKGNPNIGSVILNQISQSDEFNAFANSFNAGDRIFIISSIFGGTGASGFPLLLKTLRTGINFPNNNLINNAPIGALTILPYFKLKQDENSEIDSSTFISKTKSALDYYDKNISKNGSIDALYFLADDMANTYDNHEGGSTQQNAAHLIEFFGATSLIHFSLQSTLNNNCWELGIKDLATGEVTFNDLYWGMKSMVYEPMVQFTFIANALTYKIDYFSSESFDANKGNFKDLYSGNFFQELTSFVSDYRGWLDEMKNNKNSLNLFNLNCNDKPFELVTGIKPKRILHRLSDYDLVADRFNSSVKKCKSKGMEDKFMEMLFLGTKQLFKEKIKK